MIDLSAHFPRYTAFDPLVPVWCVTPELAGCFHRFFDTSPISPSGRYLAVTRYPFEDRMPSPGEPAEVVLVDLENGSHRVLAGTRGWDTQLGAQVQWGADDTQLFFNDMDVKSWRPFGVRMNVLTGERRALEGTVYMVSADGKKAVSPCLLRTAATQAGYGVLAPPERIAANRGAPEDDGVYLTDTDTGRSRLLVSIRRIVETAQPPLDAKELRDGDFYCFHVKWSPRGDRIMLVLRFKPAGGSAMRSMLVTMNEDGTGVRVAVSARQWDRGGHHPNWCPDGEHILMNLNIAGDGLRFAQVRCDGGGLCPMTEAVPGSGHPTLHPDGRHILTDAYLHEPMAFRDGTAPLRSVDLATGREQTLVRIQTKPRFPGPRGERRVDPHPAWDRQFRRIAFNACPDGRRGVFMADLSGLLKS